MSIEIIQAGSLTTIQDAGRINCAHLGIPVSGFMDKVSAHLANQMVSNSLETELLEVTWTGVEFISHIDCSMAIAGAEFLCELDGKVVSTDQVIQLSIGSHFKMTKLICGVRAYLAFSGGIDVPIIAASKSTLLSANMGGFHGRALKKGDSVQLLNPQTVVGVNKPHWKKCVAKTTHIVRATPGPEIDRFTQVAIRQAFSQSYELSSAADRQGFRLLSTSIDVRGVEEINSAGLVPGSLQVTPDGQTILAMQDAQTTGGYPRILVVDQDQLPQLAQLRPGEDIYFFVS